MAAQFEINQLTRAGQNPCLTCGRPMKMYYKPWCPICEKPTIKYQPVLNFVQALEHLEAIGYEGVKDRMWNEYCGYFRNDTAVWLTVSPDDAGEYTEQQLADLELLKSTFETGERILLYVSW